MTQITPQPGIMDIALYQAGKSHVAGQARVLKLSANENPFGPSPKAIAAAQAAAPDLHRYPSTDHASLRAAIAEVHGLDPDRLICGVGSDEVLQFLTQSYTGPGDEVIYTEHGFSMYPILARQAGATPVCVPETERQVDVDQILNGVTDRTRLVFLTNPGNPTSTLLPESEVARLAESLPKHILLVIDGAYAEFVRPEVSFDGGVALVNKHPNVVMTRTFSKAYGLGGLRVGWGYAARDIIDVLNRVRQPFNLSNLSLATAEAAMRDREYLTFCVAENAKWRDWLVTELAAVGVPCDQSQTNFILARFADQDEAEACDALLQSRGIIVRKVAGYGIPEALRITVGDEEGSRAVAAGIKDFKEGARA
ncbi:histidinol-phosphate transaminase [Epibacterium sp. SM1979]|uniref:Histidinol-phosphate aminotransferase n=1 Tax=Tritonibacter litoralis TaxID=2662264 RepID=A0A843YEZ6_9RHOB|nr:histidinol-phosphate transaminase [Tritonibacter litoralis]MQQ09471.1 histidinol-phosphate transaminase [Tritonibacter litoralis]